MVSEYRRSLLLKSVRVVRKEFGVDHYDVDKAPNSEMIISRVFKVIR
jgi:hypothetical protein